MKYMYYEDTLSSSSPSYTKGPETEMSQAEIEPPKFRKSSRYGESVTFFKKPKFWEKREVLRKAQDFRKAQAL